MSDDKVEEEFQKNIENVSESLKKDREKVLEAYEDLLKEIEGSSNNQFKYRENIDSVSKIIGNLQKNTDQKIKMLKVLERQRPEDDGGEDIDIGSMLDELEEREEKEEKVELGLEENEE